MGKYSCTVLDKKGKWVSCRITTTKEYEDIGNNNKYYGNNNYHENIILPTSITTHHWNQHRWESNVYWSNLQPSALLF